MATRYPAADAFEHDAAEVLLDMEVDPGMMPEPGEETDDRTLERIALAPSKNRICILSA